jgi:holin-like protein
MTLSIAVVLVLLILGEAIADQFALPIPGSALGLAALAAAFAIRGGPDKGIEKLFDFAAPYFPLFFVPAAVGVIGNLDVLAVAWVAVAAAVVLGTTATILVTGLLGQALLQLASEKTRA